MASGTFVQMNDLLTVHGTGQCVKERGYVAKKRGYARDKVKSKRIEEEREKKKVGGEGETQKGLYRADRQASPLQSRASVPFALV
jgi:hypothetical protein